MTLANVELFEGISTESIEEMVNCFRPEYQRFKKGDTIAVFSSELENLYVLTSGRAHLYCVDSEGEDTLLEHYERNDIFGEVFALPYGSLGYVVQADSDCEVLSFRFASIYSRCPRACEHHTVLTENLFNLSARKSQMLALRISMISRKSVRGKLMAYFDYLREKTGSGEFESEMSYSSLAVYLCVDRTSLMRELRLMREQGCIENKGKKIKLLYETV